MKSVEHPKHPERICWGCDKYCPADDLACGNGTIRTQHPCELFGDDWLDWSTRRSQDQSTAAHPAGGDRARASRLDRRVVLRAAGCKRGHARLEVNLGVQRSRYEAALFGLLQQASGQGFVRLRGNPQTCMKMHLREPRHAVHTIERTGRIAVERAPRKFRRPR